MRATVLSLLGVAAMASAGNLVAMNIVSRQAPVESLRTLRGRQTTDTCPVGYTECETGCIELQGECCGLGDGTYCSAGNTCVDNGCCSIGDTCTGDPQGCSEEGYELCNNYCIPSGKACCDDGNWCEVDQTCSDSGCLTSDGTDALDDPSASFPGQLGATPTNRRPSPTTAQDVGSSNGRGGNANNDADDDADAGSIAQANLAVIAAGIFAAMVL